MTLALVLAKWEIEQMKTEASNGKGILLSS